MGGQERQLKMDKSRRSGGFTNSTAFLRLIDQRIDLYALGCVLYWLLTGIQVSPYDTGSRSIYKHLRITPDLPNADSVSEHLTGHVRAGDELVGQGSKRPHRHRHRA